MVGDTHTPDPVMVEAFRARLVDQAHRYVTTSRLGVQVDFSDLIDLAVELIAEYTDHLVAERDALAEDLAFELNVRGGMPSTDGGRAA